MNKIIVAFLVVLVLAALGAGGWYFFIKKSAEGGACTLSQRCEAGLTCVKNTCSSGKASSPCVTYKDCQAGLLCKNSTCTAPPSYTKYFDKIEVSKMRADMPPGPNNIPVPTTEFSGGDGLEIDVAVKENVQGEFYAEVIDPVSGEKIVTFPRQTMNRPGGWGTGTRVPNVSGDFEVDVYFNNELVYSVPIKIR